MAYYRIVDTTDDIKDREYLLGIGAAHYQTLLSTISIYRKFALNLTEDELLVLKLTLHHSADISLFNEQELASLKSSGHIK